MSNVFSTRTNGGFTCANPVLTVGFPQAQTSGNTVVLANGAVVDLNVLAKILLQNCPGLHQPLQPTTAAVPVIDVTVPAMAPVTVPATGTITAMATGTAQATTAATADVTAILSMLAAMNGTTM